MTERTPSTGRYPNAAKFVPEHYGHDDRSCAYCEAFEDGFDAAESSLRARLAAEVREIDAPSDYVLSMMVTWNECRAAVLRVLEPE